jgi:hypothetical protein
MLILIFNKMAIGNQAYNIYFFLYQDSVFLIWRFLTSPPDGGFVRNDKFNLCSVMGKQWRFAQRIAIASPMPQKTLSFRAEAQSEAKGQARNLIINYSETIIDNRYSYSIIQIGILNWKFSIILYYLLRSIFNHSDCF